MSTVGDDLDMVQRHLHDDGVLRTRTELLGWYVDGYRELLAASSAVRRVRPLDLPGRHTYGITQEWEDAATARGTHRKFTRAGLGARYQGTSLWEVEATVGLTPTAALPGITYEWERGLLSGGVDLHYRFSFPHNHQRVVRLEWQHRRLWPVTTRELDDSDTDWARQLGEPRWWLTGTGRVRTVELYEISTTDVQAYALLDAAQGAPRALTGSRTYGVERIDALMDAYAYTTSGDAQALTSEGRRYVPAYAGTFAWEADAIPPGLVFAHVGIDYTQNFPGRVTTTVMQPWELEIPDVQPPNRTLAHGIFWWERLDPDKNFETDAHHDDVRPTLSGLGWRMTLATATAGTFATQPWEVELLAGATTFTTGVLRGTFLWEEQAAVVTLGGGTVRGMLSESRQYLPVATDASPTSLAGAIRDWRSSEESLMALEVVVPDLDVTEDDVPALIPAPMRKYLRCYTLGRAFARPGEGQLPVLAEHYDRRFRRAVAFFSALSDVARKDRQFQREEAAGLSRGRPPRVQLPAAFPRVW